MLFRLWYGFGDGVRDGHAEDQIVGVQDCLSCFTSTLIGVCGEWMIWRRMASKKHWQSMILPYIQTAQLGGFFLRFTSHSSASCQPFERHVARWLGLHTEARHSAPCYGLIKAPATQCDRTSQTCLFSTTRCRCLSPCMLSSSCNPIRPQYAISLSRRFLASNIISTQRGLCTFLLSARLPQAESHPLSTLQHLKQAHLKAHVAAPTSDAVLSLERNCPISRVNHLLLCLA